MKKSMISLKEQTFQSDRPCSIQNSIKQSYQEVKMMRENKLPKGNWGDFYQNMISSDDEWINETEWDELFMDLNPEKGASI